MRKKNWQFPLMQPGAVSELKKILETLEKYDVQATFFLTNIWLDDYPEMAKKIADAGHEIAMHSVTHPHMSQLSAEEVAQELDGNYQRIVEVTGYTPQLFSLSLW